MLETAGTRVWDCFIILVINVMSIVMLLCLEYMRAQTVNNAILKTTRAARTEHVFNQSVHFLALLSPLKSRKSSTDQTI